MSAPAHLEPDRAPARSGSNPPRATWILFALAVSFFFLQLYWVGDWIADDAFIFFRYAEHWVEGIGPVYNRGERVEGYTSFLWLVILALGHALGADTVLLARVLGVVFSFACIAIVAAWPRWFPDTSWRAAGLAAVFLGACPFFVPWGLGGMDTPLFALVLTIGAILHLRDRTRPVLEGLFWGLVTLARPEGLLVFGLALARVAARRESGTWRRVGGMVAGFLALFGAHLVWRYRYYGHLTPNTFHAKASINAVHFRDGVAYLGGFALVVLPILLALAVAFATPRGRRALGRFVPVLVLVAAFALYVGALGGDFFPAYRFFTPLAPLLAVLGALSIATLARSSTSLVLGAVVVLYQVACMHFHPRLLSSLAADVVAQRGRQVGLTMRVRFPPDAVIATNTAGSIPYYSRLQTIDMLGLNDEHIARRRIRVAGREVGHEKHDGRYVLARRPDWIQFQSSYGARLPWFPGDIEIAYSPEFGLGYVYEAIPLIDNPNQTFSIYRRKSATLLPAAPMPAAANGAQRP